MPPILEELLQHIRDHGSKLTVAALFTFLGWGVGRWRARRAWQKRDFLNRLNFTLNIIEDGRLVIRTLMEKPCDEVFMNQSAVEQVLIAARQTSAESPFLPLAKEDYWFYLNQILNELSEKFAEGALKRDLKLPVTSARYLISLTSESVGEIRTRKIRAMLIRKDQLINFPDKTPEFERPHHSTRWDTLQKMKVAYEKTPHLFLEMELSV
jgi:hypothetical protein